MQLVLGQYACSNSNVSELSELITKIEESK